MSFRLFFPALLNIGLATLANPVYALTFSDVPLFVMNRADPNVMIDLSIESPMIGAAYNDQLNSVAGCTGRAANEGGYNIGTCYFKTQQYLGYFDPTKCYTYSSSRFNPVANKSYVIGASATCTGDWSGNFLNWATMTAIDEFRFAMSGGHRSTDTSTTTVLQRANMNLGKGDSWFPIKKIGTSIAPGNVAPSTVTPYSDSTLYVYSHDTRLDVGTTTSANEKFTNRNVRVEVCNSTAGLESNCKTYGTSHKPEGLIQTNADRMRFSLVSYLLDSNQSRDGGVLRAKMKYTGPTMHVSGTGSVANPNAEWSGTDGTLIANPDSADATASSVTNSGIINYINKFGANGYKGYDPAAELYYEALRYFKNLGPTPEYSSGLTAAMKDDFPVITTWDDPIQAWCQKNFIVGINDANPWLDKKLPGTFFTCNKAGTTGMPGSFTAGDCGEPSNPDSSINVTTLTNTVGALEGLNGAAWSNTGTWTSGTATGTNDSVGYFPGDTNPGSCSVSKTITSLGEVMGTCPWPPKQNAYYIAGLAYYANTQDIRNDLQGKQTVATYMIDTQEYNSNPLDGPKNMLWLAGKYGGFIDTNGDDNPNSSTSGSSTSEWDADGDGVPDSYVLATEPDKLVYGLQSAFSNILARIGSAASVATNSTNLRIESRIYQARFSSADWSGQLMQYQISTAGVLAPTAEWDAGALLQSATGRKIITKGTSDGVAFQWSNLTSAQQTALHTNASGNNDGLGSNRLNYLRGTDATGFRARATSKLGDIVNSNPWYVAKPDAGYSDVDHPGYSTFRSTYASRTPVVYVGGNDGMLHGFDASLDFSTVTSGVPTTTAGTEVIAYVPSAVYGNLSRLTDMNYDKNHRFFVDGSPMIGDAYLGATVNGWRTVLIGGLGAGGKGYYALDVTNPAGFSESGAAPANILLWELDETDMGYAFNQPPAILKTNQAKQIVKLASGKWAAVLGNGYNSASGKAVLYVVHIEDGVDGTWSVGDFVKIVADAPVGLDNGLSTPVPFDSNGDGYADTVYAGDLKGKLWKFLIGPNGSDASVTANPSTWKIAFSTNSWSAGTATLTCTSCTPLFVATNASSQIQPITWPAEVTLHPYGGQMVLFGTGKYLESGDNSTSQVQSFYGIWDWHNGTHHTITRTDLLAQSVTSSVISGKTYRTPSTNPITFRGLTCVPPYAANCNVGTHMGWYMDLPTSGERLTGIPKLEAGTIFFNTFIPSTAPCDAGGTGWLMTLDYLNGGLLNFPMFDTNNDGVVDSSDTIVGGLQIGAALGGTTLIQGVGAGTTGVGVSSLTSGSMTTTMINFGPGSRGRISWREIIQ